MAYDTASLREGSAAACARAWPGQGESRDTKLCIVAEGQSCAVIQCSQGCDKEPNALRHGAGALRHAGQGPVLRYKVCIMTGGDDREAVTRLCVAIQ